MNQQTITEAQYQLHQLTRRVHFNRQIIEAAQGRIEIDADAIAAVFDEIHSSLLSISTHLMSGDEPSKTSQLTASMMAADQSE